MLSNMTGCACMNINYIALTSKMFFSLSSFHFHIKCSVLYSLSYHYFSSQTPMDQPCTINNNFKITHYGAQKTAYLALSKHWLVDFLTFLFYCLAFCLVVMDGLHILYMSLNHKSAQSRVLLLVQDIRQAVFYICAPKYFHQDFMD